MADCIIKAEYNARELYIVAASTGSIVFLYETGKAPRDLEVLKVDKELNVVNNVKLGILKKDDIYPLCGE